MLPILIVLIAKVDYYQTTKSRLDRIDIARMHQITMLYLPVDLV